MNTQQTSPNQTVSVQLPRGRHGLSRAEVVQSQRDRILIAMAEAMAEKGYASTSVADVLRRARVSRETFYQQFSSKEDCFQAAYGRAVEVVMHGILGTGLVGAGPSGTGTESVDSARLERLLGAYLDTLADQPAFARLFLVEVYAAGRDVLARRAELQDGFVDLIASILRARTAEQRFACQLLAAAISSMVTAKIAVGDVDGLRALRTPIVDMVRRGGPLYGEFETAD
jgi:AcrR family transcriptional regulator